MGTVWPGSVPATPWDLRELGWRSGRAIPPGQPARLRSGLSPADAWILDQGGELPLCGPGRRGAVCVLRPAGSMTTVSGQPRPQPAGPAQTTPAGTDRNGGTEPGPSR